MRTARIIIVLVLCATILPASASELLWSSRPYLHLAYDEKLSDFLRDYLAHHGFHPVISPKVTGSISGSFQSGAKPIPRNTNTKIAVKAVATKQSVEARSSHYADQIFEQIIAAYGLIWYLHGKTIYIYKDVEIESSTINLNYVSPEKLVEILQVSEIYDYRYPIKIVPDFGLIQVSGPPFLVSAVAEIAALLEQKSIDQKLPKEVIRVFHLNYAWADDIQFKSGKQTVSIPGVATILRNLLKDKGSASVVTGNQVQPAMHTLSKLKGQGLAAGRLDASVDKDIQDTLANNSSNESSEVFVQADSRLNAVVIRDSSDKMETYAQLIESLDKPPGLVEIKASIIDVYVDKVKELGIDWRLLTGGGGLKGSSGFNADSSLTFDNGSIGLGQGFLLGTIVGSASDHFISVIRAMQKNGTANVLSRPSILTLNNMEAIFEDTQTFYVRIAGDEEVDLYDVTTGIVMKVTPHIIKTDDHRMIKLSIEIQDGAVRDDFVDDIPLVEQSIVTTQAVIKENSSILIGGIVNEEKTEVVQKVPVLGDIPLLGLAFRKKVETKAKKERLFLISPRIVDNDVLGSFHSNDSDSIRSERSSPIPHDWPDRPDRFFDRFPMEKPPIPLPELKNKNKGYSTPDPSDTKQNLNLLIKKVFKTPNKSFKTQKQLVELATAPAGAVMPSIAVNPIPKEKGTFHDYRTVQHNTKQPETKKNPASYYAEDSENIGFSGR